MIKDKRGLPQCSSSATDLARITQAVRDWSQERPVQLCVLFGSQASARVHAHSDVDLALWTSAPLPSATRLRWICELETALAQDVSLVLVSADLDPVLGFEIVRQGRLIFEAQPGLWMERRAQLWHAYNDSLPFRRAARQRLREFAQEVRRDA
jgi:predicted nucleotidyltransferase